MAKKAASHSRRTKDAKRLGPPLAMPLFSTTKPVSPKAVVEAWAKLFAAEPPLTSAGGKDDPVTYRAADRTIMAIHVPLPVPKAEAVGAIRTSWMWQQSDDAVLTHRAHAIVTAFGSDNPIAGAWDVARISAAMLHAGSGVALYWGSSRQVHVPKLVVEFAAEARRRPVPLWVGITISADAAAGPFSATTHGLEAFGHKELEVLETTMGVGKLRMTLLDVASYLLEQGPVLLDGQTFGPTAKDAWTIRHTKSKLVSGRDVIVLGVP